MAPSPPPDDLISTADAAALLRCSRATVRRYCRVGRLPSWRRVGTVLVSREDVLGLLVPVGKGKARAMSATARAERTARLLAEHGLG